MSPLLLVVIVAACVAFGCWLLSVITHEHSWIDRIWSVVPVVYVWIFAIASAFDTRLVVMAVLVTAWGARLTFNFARKGGYSGEEDYRWAVLRGRMKRWQFEIFNVGFIVGYQSIVLVAITLPAYTAYSNPGGFGVADVLVALVFALCLIGETAADQQQWDFHQAKRAAMDAGTEPTARFLTTGLWRFSRHPNFFFELAQWWVFYLFAVTSGVPLSWTVIGAILLTSVFIGSTRFTESITRSKYPEYVDYQAVTSPVVPWLPRRRGASPHATGVVR